MVPPPAASPSASSSAWSPRASVPRSVSLPAFWVSSAAIETVLPAGMRTASAAPGTTPQLQVAGDVHAPLAAAVQLAAEAPGAGTGAARVAARREAPSASRGALPLAAVVLRAVHRRVGLVEERLRAVVGVCHGDPDAHADARLGAEEVERALELALTRCATQPASLTAFRSSHSTVNSSPPSRATVSAGRTARRIRSAAWRSSSSPAAWPRLSLTFLKRSRSMKRTAMRSFERRERSTACARRSAKRTRLARPVSGSCSVSSVSRSAASFCSLMSWICDDEVERGAGLVPHERDAQERPDVMAVGVPVALLHRVGLALAARAGGARARGRRRDRRGA